MKFRNGKPERFALAFQSRLSLHLHGDKVERPCPAPDTSGDDRIADCVTFDSRAARVAPESPDHTGLPRSFLLWLADVEAGATRSKATATMRRVTKRGGFLL